MKHKEFVIFAHLAIIDVFAIGWALCGLANLFF